MFNDIFLIFTMDTPLKASEISTSKLQKEQIFKKYQNQQTPKGTDI